METASPFPRREGTGWSGVNTSCSRQGWSCACPGAGNETEKGGEHKTKSKPRQFLESNTCGFSSAKYSRSWVVLSLSKHRSEAKALVFKASLHWHWGAGGWEEGAGQLGVPPGSVGFSATPAVSGSGCAPWFFPPPRPTPCTGGPAPFVPSPTRGLRVPAPPRICTGQESAPLSALAAEAAFHSACSILL